VRDGKLFVNPLHLLVEEVQLSEVKCSEFTIGPSEFTVFFTGMWVVFDFMFGKQPADCCWYSRDAMLVGFCFVSRAHSWCVRCCFGKVVLLWCVSLL